MLTCLPNRGEASQHFFCFETTNRKPKSASCHAHRFSPNCSALITPIEYSRPCVLLYVPYVVFIRRTGSHLTECDSMCLLITFLVPFGAPSTRRFINTFSRSYHIVTTARKSFVAVVAITPVFPITDFHGKLDRKSVEHVCKTN